jgi:hypothetical protein
MDPSVAVNNCTLCSDIIELTPFGEQETEKRLDCSHVFHRKCINEWQKGNHGCPLCPRKIDILTPEEPQSPQEDAPEDLNRPRRRTRSHGGIFTKVNGSPVIETRGFVGTARMIPQELFHIKI